MTAKFRAPSLALLAVLLVFCAWIHLTNLRWGLPGMKKTLNVMGSEETLNRLAPEMAEQRRKYYEMVGRLFDENHALRRAHEDLTHRWDLPYYEPIPREGVLDRMRNYLIGANVSDEQIALSAIRGMNPIKLDFVPGPMAYYGVLYYYTAAAFLAAGKISGWVAVTPDVEFYFSHPDEVRKIYMLLRAVGGVSIVLAVAALALLAGRFYGEKFGLLSAAFLATFPLTVPVSHLTKAHLFGMFWIALALGFAMKILKSENPSQGLARPFMGLGACLGLSVGAIFTNLTSGVLIFFAEWAAQNWKILPALKSRRFWAASGLFLLVSAAVNFHILYEWFAFQRYVQSGILYFPVLLELGLREWPPYIREVFTEQISIFAAPLLAAGIYFSFRRREKFMQACFLAFAVLFLQNLVTTRHAPINARFLPMAAVLSAWGFSSLWGAVQGRLGRAVLSASLAAVLGMASVQCVYYWWMHRSPTRLDIAGEWINQNAPKGASFAAWGNSFAPLEFPPIQFLDYKLIPVPHAHRLDSWSVPIPIKKMPRFLVLGTGYAHGQAHYPESRLIEENYQTAREWKDGCPLPEKWFGSVWIRTGNWSVKVMEKKPRI